MQNPSNFFDKPEVVAVPYLNRIRCRWKAVANPTNSAGNPTGIVQSYGIFEGGTLNWTCPNCQNVYQNSYTPTVCPHCQYSGSDWDWEIKDYVTRTFVSGTEYTATDQVGGNVIRVYTRGIRFLWDYQEGDDFIAYEAAYSEPVTVFTANSGSIVPSGTMSVLKAARYVEGTNDYPISYADITSLIGITYNSNLNKFSSHLPGYDMKAYQSAITNTAKLWEACTLQNSWQISGSSSAERKSASLQSFAGYTNAYEYGCKSGSFFFPWGNIKFSSGNLDVHKGIVSSSTISGSFRLNIYSTIAGTFTNSEIDRNYNTLQKGLWIKSNASNTYTKLSNINLNNLAFAGLTILNDQTNEIYYIRDLSSLGYRQGLSPNAGVLTTLTGSLISFPNQTYLKGSKVFPTIFINPTFDGGLWKMSNMSVTTTLASQVLLAEGCYLNVSSSLRS